MNRIILIGAGPLGLKVADCILKRSDVELAGVVDLNASLRGKRIRDLMDGVSSEAVVSGSLEEALAGAGKKPDAAVVTTVSSIRKIVPTIQAVAEQNLDVVTTCEELSYPWKRHPAEAAEIDRVCQANGVSCLGTGVNPGFLMDYLPSVLSSITQRVDRILVERVQDASARRVPFQKKIGAGLSPEEFERARKNGALRHVGLAESLDMVAAALNWDLDESTETLEPVLAPADCNRGHKPIRKGAPCGVEQIATGTVDGRQVIRLRFRAAVGEAVCYDRISIDGLPGVEVTIQGGVNGDVATAAITVNAIRSAVQATPGLRTMLDVPVPSCSRGAAQAAAPV